MFKIWVRKSVRQQINIGFTAWFFCREGSLERQPLMDLSVVAINCYRPQTKFAKVMFLQVSVCPQREGVPGGVCVCVCGGGVRGRGACMAEGHVWQGGVCGKGGCGGGMHGTHVPSR